MTVIDDINTVTRSFVKRLEYKNLKFMKTHIVTRESVESAAATLLAMGQRHSVRAIMAHLGGGSPNKIAHFLKDFNAALIPRTAQVDVDPAIGRLIAQQILLASAAAASVAMARAQEAEADHLVIAAAGASAEDRAAELEEELALALAQIQQQQGQLNERSAELLKAKDAAASAIAIADSKAEQERAIAEGLRQDLVRAFLLTEALPKIEAQRDEFANQVRDSQIALAEARQVAAVTAAGKQAESARAEEAVHRETLAISAIQRLTIELAEARSIERASLESSHEREKALTVALADVQDRFTANVQTSRRSSLRKSSRSAGESPAQNSVVAL